MLEWMIKKNVLLLSGYDVLDKEGNALTTMDDRIVMIPRGEIKYVELCYDEKSDVKKYWFKR